MKKIISLFLLVTCLYAVPGQVTAQVLLNGDLTLPNSGNDYTGYPACTTFSNTSVPNWKRSHGAPVIVNTADPYVYLDEFALEAEGFYGSYTFMAGQAYTIEIGLKDWFFSWPTRLSVEVVACNGLTQAPFGSGILACHGNFAGVTTSSQYVIGYVPGWTTTYTLNMPPQPIQYDQIWIYLKADIVPAETLTVVDGNVSVDYVHIKVPCKSSIIFANGAVAPGYYQGYDHIYAGSSFGTGGSNVTISGSTHTEFIAASSVAMQNNFEATAGTGSAFVAQIYPCQPVDGGGDGGDGGMGKSATAIGTKIIERVNKIGLHPSPNDGRFTITLPDAAVYAITVSDIVGKIVYRTSISGTGDHTIQMQEVNAGNYLLTISDGETREVKRMVIK